MWYTSAVGLILYLKTILVWHNFKVVIVDNGVLGIWLDWHMCTVTPSIEDSWHTIFLMTIVYYYHHLKANKPCGVGI
jgi:hypothetical protein